MRTGLRSVFYFLLTIAAVVLTLVVLNRLPLVLQRDTLRPYASLDEARSRLNIRELKVPTYFPQSITWPPARILAQSKPYPALLMVFHRGPDRDPALVISQAASDSFTGDSYITFVRITEKAQYQLKGRRSLLEVGTCSDDEQPCSRIAWTEGNMRTIVQMKSSPFETIRIAESMLR